AHRDRPRGRGRRAGPGRLRSDRDHGVSMWWVPPVARRVSARSCSLSRQPWRDRDTIVGRPPARRLRAVKSGFVAVAGRPNVGKSTLVNALCGGKVAIVSDKPQTTRRRIFGIANTSDYQLVLADLPGFQRPRDALTEHMQRTVDSAF